MSRTRRNFKSDLVLEVLKGEKELNVIATENGIQPNLLRNWKKEFLRKLLWSLTTPERRTLKKNSPRSAKKKLLTQRRSASSPCRWTG